MEVGLNQVVFSLDAAHPSYGSPNTSRRFALGARDVVCLGGEKTRRAPSRSCRDARVYCHTTTSMREMSTPPPPAFFSRLLLSPPCILLLTPTHTKPNQTQPTNFVLSCVFLVQHRFVRCFSAVSSGTPPPGNRRLGRSRDGGGAG